MLAPCWAVILMRSFTLGVQSVLQGWRKLFAGLAALEFAVTIQRLSFRCWDEIPPTTLTQRHVRFTPVRLRYQPRDRIHLDRRNGCAI